MKQITWFDRHLAFQQYVNENYSAKQTRQIISETESGLFRVVLPLMGFAPAIAGRKITKAEKAACFEYMQLLVVEQLPEAEKRFSQALPNLPLTKSSRNTYGSRTRNWFTFQRESGYWPVKLRTRSAAIQKQCSPHKKRGHGGYRSVRISERRAPYPRYRLLEHERPAHLLEFASRFEQFLTRPQQPGRVFDPVRRSTAQYYLKELWLMMGWLRQSRALEPAELFIECLLPVVPVEEGLHLSGLEEKAFWRPRLRAVEEWLCEYYEFLWKTVGAKSPDTWRGKLLALHAFARFLYADWVEVEEDYDSIPLFKFLNTRIKQVAKQCNQRQQRGEKLEDQSKKWPDTTGYRTALDAVVAEVAEPLRQECVPRNPRGGFYPPHVIALQCQHHFKVCMVIHNPARRQQDDRETKIALSCPLARPAEIPANGLYYPLPPNSAREKNDTGEVIDKYLYRVYHLEGQDYPEGVWVRDIRGYKTDEHHGGITLILPNRRFSDGRCLYDYLEEYLAGIWVSGKYLQTRQLYTWWDPTLQGTMGRWATSGRAALEPIDMPLAEDNEGLPWRFGYLFIGSKTRLPFTEKTYGKSIKGNTFRMIGKRMNPHMFRNIWATWAVQMGLSDEEMRSLAFMMGHSVETLRRIYERTTSLQKQAHVENAIQRWLAGSSLHSKSTEEIMQLVKQLPATEQQALLTQIQQLIQEGQDSA